MSWNNAQQNLKERILGRLNEIKAQMDAGDHARAKQNLVNTIEFLSKRQKGFE